MNSTQCEITRKVAIVCHSGGVAHGSQCNEFRHVHGGFARRLFNQQFHSRFFVPFSVSGYDGPIWHCCQLSQCEPVGLCWCAGVDSLQFVVKV